MWRYTTMVTGFNFLNISNDEQLQSRINRRDFYEENKRREQEIIRLRNISKDNARRRFSKTGRIKAGFGRARRVTGNTFEEIDNFIDNSRQSRNTRFELGRNIGQAARFSLMQRPDFTQEQEALRNLFGGGEKIWGTNQNPVTLYNDLNPSQRGDDGTARLFGL